jgi:hypothetical protein
MELIERIPLKEINFLNAFTLADIKQYYTSCKNDKERREQLNILKSFCATNIKTNGQTKRIYSYSLSTPLSSGGRLYCGNSVQGLAKPIRGLLMKHTTDIDMKNAHPVILKYICNKHGLRHPMLSEYILNRDAILSEFDDKEKGKTAYLCAINDDELNKKIKNKQFRAFDEEMKALQTQITMLPEYQNIKSSVPDNKQINWNGSALNRILCMYENQILQTCISALNQRSIEIQVLMFDGVMIMGNYYEDSELLQYITNHVNEVYPDLNMVWCYKEHSNAIIIPDDFQIIDTSDRLYAQNDLEARNLVYDIIKNDIVFCKGVLYYRENHIWIDSSSSIFDMLIELVMSLKIYKRTEKDDVEYSHIYSCAKNITLSVICLVKSNSNNNWLKIGQYSSLGKILFENGYYDFKKSNFYTFDHPDFDTSIVFTGKIHHSFEAFNSDDMDYMETIARRLFYNTLGVSVGDYLILNIARGLAGDMMKRIMFGLGGTNTGKSVLTSAISLSCGDYFGSFNAENLAYRNTGSDEAQIMRWAMLLKNKRIIISNEIKSTTELNGNMIKKISSGGDTIIGRNHCQSEEEFIMQPLAICLANDLPTIKPYDDAVENRIRVVNYIKQYVDEPTNEFELKKDDSIIEEMKTLRFQKCFIGLLIREYVLMQQNGISDEPVEVIKAKQDWINTDKSFLDSFVNDFQLTNNEEDFVASKEIEEWLKSKNLGISMKKFGMEMTKHKLIHKLNKIEGKSKKVRGKVVQVWIGIKMIEEEGEDM